MVSNNKTLNIIIRISFPQKYDASTICVIIPYFHRFFRCVEYYFYRFILYSKIWVGQKLSHYIIVLTFIFDLWDVSTYIFFQIKHSLISQHFLYDTASWWWYSDNTIFQIKLSLIRQQCFFLKKNENRANLMFCKKYIQVITMHVFTNYRDIIIGRVCSVEKRAP